MSDGNAAAVELSLLRGFELHVERHVVRLVWSAQRLVAFLALQERPVSRPYVAGVLWPETTSVRANANLRSALWRAQRSCARLIAASSQNVAIDDAVVIDFRVATSRAHRLITGEDPSDEDICASTCAGLSADLLVDWYDDWVAVERECYHQLRLHALEVLCARLTAVQRYGEAVDAGLAAVRAEPLRESAHRILIHAYLAEGNRVEAIRQYQRCSRILHDELGLEPSASLRDLVPAQSQPPSTNGRPRQRIRV